MTWDSSRLRRLLRERGYELESGAFDLDRFGADLARVTGRTAENETRSAFRWLSPSRPVRPVQRANDLAAFFAVDRDYILGTDTPRDDLKETVKSAVRELLEQEQFPRLQALEDGLQRIADALEAIESQQASPRGRRAR